MELNERTIGWFCVKANILFLIKLNNLINEIQIIYDSREEYSELRNIMGYKLINIYRQDGIDGRTSGYTFSVWLNGLYERFRRSQTYGDRRPTFTSEDVHTEITYVSSIPIPADYMPPASAPKQEYYLKYLKYKNKYIALKKMLNQ